MSNVTQEWLDAYYARLKQPQQALTPETPLGQAIQKLPKARMNKLESEYAQELENQKRCGLIQWWAFEPMKLRLAGNTYYSPDFGVMAKVIDASSGSNWLELEFHEVKGFWRDDARVKIKVAAEHFPFVFRAIKKKKQRDGGGWDVEVFEAAQ